MIKALILFVFAFAALVGGAVDIRPEELEAVASSRGEIKDAKAYGFCKKACKNKDERCILNGICVPPCSSVCNKWPICDDYFEDPPVYPIAWWNFENRKCWQFETDQNGNPFIRTKCRCPTRDYTVSTCDSTASARLSNCVQAFIVQGPEINFGKLDKVKLGLVQAFDPGADVDFQGDTTDSLICRTKGHDIEFGGLQCPITASNNYFQSFEMSDDLQFEEGTTVESNIFRDIYITDDMKVQNEPGSAPTTIKDNRITSIHVGDKCSSTGSLSVLIDNNQCVTATGDLNGCYIYPWANPGFSCF